MCNGTGRRFSERLDIAIACAWCGGWRLVTVERGRQLRAQQETKRARETERERAA
jgi:hypothetical protein